MNKKCEFCIIIFICEIIKTKIGGQIFTFEKQRMFDNGDDKWIVCINHGVFFSRKILSRIIKQFIIFSRVIDLSCIIAIGTIKKLSKVSPEFLSFPKFQIINSLIGRFEEKILYVKMGEKE